MTDHDGGPGADGAAGSGEEGGVLAPLSVGSRRLATVLPAVVLAVAVVLGGISGLVVWAIGGLLAEAGAPVGAGLAAIPLSALGIAAVALGLLVASWRRRVTVDATGRLTVTGLFGSRSVDANALAAVWALPTRRGGSIGPVWPLTVADRWGETVTINLHVLADRDALAQRLATAVGHSDAAVGQTAGGILDIEPSGADDAVARDHRRVAAPAKPNDNWDRAAGP